MATFVGHTTSRWPARKRRRSVSAALGVDVNGLDVRCPIVSSSRSWASWRATTPPVVKWESSSGANLGDDLSSVTSLLYVAVCFPAASSGANVGNHPSSTRRGSFASFCLAALALARGAVVFHDEIVADDLDVTQLALGWVILMAWAMVAVAYFRFLVERGRGEYFQKPLRDARDWHVHGLLRRRLPPAAVAVEAKDDGAAAAVASKVIQEEEEDDDDDEHAAPKPLLVRLKEKFCAKKKKRNKYARAKPAKPAKSKEQLQNELVLQNSRPPVLTVATYMTCVVALAVCLGLQHGGVVPSSVYSLIDDFRALGKLSRYFLQQLDLAEDVADVFVDYAKELNVTGFNITTFTQIANVTRAELDAFAGDLDRAADVAALACAQGSLDADLAAACATYEAAASCAPDYADGSFSRACGVADTVDVAGRIADAAAELSDYVVPYLATLREALEFTDDLSVTTVDSSTELVHAAEVSFSIAIWSAFAWTFPFILAVLYQWDCAVGALRRGDAQEGGAHAPLVKGPNILGQMVSGWFWAFTFLLVILWVVVMCVVFPPIRDYILTYQWAAISFVITFILKGQILTPKLYNKKASDGKIITFRRRRLFFRTLEPNVARRRSRAYYALCCVAWMFYGFATGAFAALTRMVYFILWTIQALFIYDGSLLPGPSTSERGPSKVHPV
ncbi:very-long-chain enoyl-CoA reductase [Aureococcus anophagefferens]|nr:very-long-chain enoyl-CoA reductase [Aureococcus anophagefferens]